MLFDAGCAICGETAGPVCLACADSLVAAGPLRLCGLDGAHSAFWLTTPARELVASFKYKRQRRLADWLAERVAADLPVAADCITWVPATPERRRRRGFDQAHELAYALSRRTDVPVRGLLTRAASDIRQTGLSRKDRLSGPALATTLERLQPGGSGLVVVVDDVVTTGASLRCAADLVRRRHGSRVFAITAAATPLG